MTVVVLNEGMYIVSQSAENRASETVGFSPSVCTCMVWFIEKVTIIPFVVLTVFGESPRLSVKICPFQLLVSR